LALAVTCFAALYACSPDVLDVDVDLAPHAFPADFGPPSNNTIPIVTCDATMAGVCGGNQTLAVTTSDGSPDVSVNLGCDSSTSRCFAQAHARMTYGLDVLQDDAFITRVERHVIPVVRVVDIAYTIPNNTLTFEIPQVDVYVGPAGTHAETDADVVLVDSIRPIAAGLPVTDARHLTLAANSDARTLIESSIQNKETFVFVVVTAPRLEAGAPVPSGAFEIDIFPKVTLGLPR
jgi:hypothetical protein